MEMMDSLDKTGNPEPMDSRCRRKANSASIALPELRDLLEKQGQRDRPDRPASPDRRLRQPMQAPLGRQDLKDRLDSREKLGRRDSPASQDSSRMSLANPDHPDPLDHPDKLALLAPLEMMDKGAELDLKGHPGKQGHQGQMDSPDSPDNREQMESKGTRADANIARRQERHRDIRLATEERRARGRKVGTCRGRDDGRDRSERPPPQLLARISHVSSSNSHLLK